MCSSPKEFRHLFSRAWERSENAGEGATVRRRTTMSGFSGYRLGVGWRRRRTGGLWGRGAGALTLLQTAAMAGQEDPVQREIHQDWANREYIEVITSSIKKIADFLNSFGQRAGWGRRGGGRPRRRFFRGAEEELSGDPRETSALAGFRFLL